MSVASGFASHAAIVHPIGQPRQIAKHRRHYGERLADLLAVGLSISSGHNARVPKVSSPVPPAHKNARAMPGVSIGTDSAD
jgi:hypothetical protein